VISKLKSPFSHPQWRAWRHADVLPSLTVLHRPLYLNLISIKAAFYKG
jgi:hypothetical protein